MIFKTFMCMDPPLSGIVYLSPSHLGTLPVYASLGDVNQPRVWLYGIFFGKNMEKGGFLNLKPTKRGVPLPASGPLHGVRGYTTLFGASGCNGDRLGWWFVWGWLGGISPRNQK